MDGPKRARRHVALTLVVLVLASAACSGERASAEPSDTTVPSTTPTDPTTTTESVVTTTMAPSTTTTIDVDEWLAERVAKIEEMVADRNSGDFDAWRAHFIAESPDIFGSPREDDSELEFQHSFMAANEIWTITGDCRMEGTQSVSCPFTMENDFHGPAGIFFTVPGLNFRFDDDLQISAMGANSWHIAGDMGEYNTAFDAWLARAHPDVHASFGPRVEGEDGLPNPEDMPTALEYVEEFLAQSDEYPVDVEE